MRKICSKCNHSLHITSFYKDLSKPDKLKSECKLCGIKTNKNIKKFKSSHRKVFNLSHQAQETSTVDFINKYHKNYHFWTNKIAYLAGLVDGEGYLKIEKWGTIRLIIGMCDKKTIYWIKKNFGGNVKHQKTHNGRKFYVWRMNQGKDLFYLLLLIIPFLINKKKRLVKAFEILIARFNKLESQLPNNQARI